MHFLINPPNPNHNFTMPKLWEIYLMMIKMPKKRIKTIKKPDYLDDDKKVKKRDNLDDDKDKDAKETIWIR